MYSPLTLKYSWLLIFPSFCHADDRKHPDAFIHGKEERDPSSLRMTRMK